MTDKEQNLEDWLAEEQARLDKGFSFEPKPSSEASKPGAGEDVLAGLGLGAGVAGGALAPHPNPVTFEGCKAEVIVNALRNEVAESDTRFQVDKTDDSAVVTILQSQENRPHQFSPAVTVTLLETDEVLTVTVSELDQDSVRSTISSLGNTILDQGKRVLFRRRGIRGVLDTADDLLEGVEDLVEDIQDFGLPKKVWEVIDRVGGAAEEAYLSQQQKERERQRERRAAERAWTHCEWCGRAYGDKENDKTACPSCGASREPKPTWLA
jgi:hypothetical protein